MFTFHDDLLFNYFLGGLRHNKFLKIKIKIAGLNAISIFAELNAILIRFTFAINQKISFCKKNMILFVIYFILLFQKSNVWFNIYTLCIMKYLGVK